jgi:hypothetical protein
MFVLIDTRSAREKAASFGITATITSSEALTPLASQVKPFQQGVATSFEKFQADDSSTCCLAAALSSAMRASI